MTWYCDVCCLSFDSKRCPVCGRKNTRQPEPDDLFFLTEQEQLWSDMLADVLTQRSIPFVRKNVLGAGVAIKTGPMRERVRFYVFQRQLPEAKNVVAELFSAAGDEAPRP